MPEEYISYAQQRTRARRLILFRAQREGMKLKVWMTWSLCFNQTPATDHRIKGSTGKTMNAQEKVAEGE